MHTGGSVYPVCNPWFPVSSISYLPILSLIPISILLCIPVSVSTPIPSPIPISIFPLVSSRSVRLCLVKLAPYTKENSSLH